MGQVTGGLQRCKECCDMVEREGDVEGTQLVWEEVYHSGEPYLLCPPSLSKLRSGKAGLHYYN